MINKQVATLEEAVAGATDGATIAVDLDVRREGKRWRDEIFRWWYSLSTTTDFPFSFGRSCVKRTVAYAVTSPLTVEGWPSG